MESLRNLSPLFTAIIAFTAVLSFLLVGMNSILDAKIAPIKENQARMEKQMEKRMDRMESKLDQLLSNKRQPASAE